MKAASPPTLTLPRLRGRGGWGLLPLMAALTATAWLTLWLWGQGPYAGYLDHGNWTQIGVAGVLCRALPGGGEALTALLVAGGWVLMLSAMMLPTTLPLLDIFRRLTAQRADRGWLMVLLVIGYLAIWGAFGLAAHLADRAVLFVAGQSDWLVANGWIFGAAVLAIAGLYQFSALKYRCLDKCRAPLGFVIEHWRGTRERWHALLLGVRHGAFCVGCCWALMLLMFVVGTANIGWMLILGAVMAAEKNLPGGRRLAAPLGAVLLFAALSMAIAGTTS
jgi:predicted metal-binding membrane protein